MSAMSSSDRSILNFPSWTLRPRFSEVLANDNSPVTTVDATKVYDTKIRMGSISKRGFGPYHCAYVQ